jgi:hypothetical protein
MGWKRARAGAPVYFGESPYFTMLIFQKFSIIHTLISPAPFLRAR